MTTQTPSPLHVKTGYFFGTFNPIHLGHLLMAETALSAFELERILFVPTGIPPHRQRDLDMAPALDRFKMVQLATGSHAQFLVWDGEIHQDSPCYTFDTLQRLFPEGFPVEKKIPLVIGADAFETLPTWYHFEELAQIAWFLRAPRLGGEEGAFSQGNHPIHLSTPLPMPCIEISSTEIRRRLRAGESIRYWVPEGVEAYLKANQLY